ncbi:tetratricopeptide repeat protein, partial [Helicobacter cetorum]|uniref:tetratricopeptide repeat protein n=1 Tax=Helicobacter cetorum TaxID=138563 RepID=UPI0013159516
QSDSDCKHLAELYEKQNKPELAEKYYQKLCDKYESDSDCKHLAELYEKQNKPELAEKYYQKLCDKKSSYCEDLLKFYEKQNKPELAEKTLQKICHGDSGCYKLRDFYLRQAQSFEKQNKLEEATTYYQKAFERIMSSCGSEHCFLSLYASEYKKLGETIIDSLERRCLKDSNKGIFKGSCSYLVDVYLYRGTDDDLKRALEITSQGCNINHSDPDACKQQKHILAERSYRQAQNFDSQGEKDEARDLYHKACKLDEEYCDRIPSAFLR